MTQQSIALDSAIADQRGQDPIYATICKLDIFLHDLMEVEEYKDIAASLHGEIHEAAFMFVTRPEGT